MMKTRLFRNLMAFLFVVAASTAALEAKAATYNLGTLAATSTTNIGGIPQGVHFGLPGSSFTDSYTFTVAAPADLNAAAFSFNLPIIIGLSSFTATLYEDGIPVAGGVGGPGVISALSLSYANLAATSAYHLDISGTLGSFSIAGKYWGVIQLSAVPVPAALPLFASGLAAFGVFARRRRRIAA